MIKHITSAKDIDSLVTRQDEGEWVPYKTKAATAKDFFSNVMAKPNDQLITPTNSEKILGMSTLAVSISRINYASGGLGARAHAPDSSSSSTARSTSASLP